MREHKINQLNNFIMGWYMDQSDIDSIDELLHYYHKNEGNVNRPGTYGDNKIDKNVKDSIDASFGPAMMSRLKYGKVLKHCLDLYNDKYPTSACCGYSLQEAFAVQYYPPMGGYKIWHCEKESADLPDAFRHLVFMTYLNDVDDAGGTEFLHQNVTIKAEKGLTIIWPAEWMFTHRGVVSPTQEKYIVTGWLSLLKEGHFDKMKETK